MNKKLFMPLLACMFAACSDSVQEDLVGNMPRTRSVEVETDHRVRYSDIVTLTNGSSIAPMTVSAPSYEIECLTNEANDTLLYVYKNQGGGWTIYSSDTRVPAIVAQSDEGSFAELMQIDGARLWIEAMVEEMEAIRQSDDNKLNFTPKEIEDNKAFWRSISSPDGFVKTEILQGGIQTASVVDPPISGHYELTYSDTYSEEYDTSPRLTKTNWHQHDPFNRYCPLKSNSATERAPAGCVAIAAAQMLYFLHYHFGVPATAPSEAYCYGTTKDHPNYNWAQTNYTTTVWDKMGDGNITGLAAAPLIADVGRRVNMKYQDGKSGALPKDLVDGVFAPYGISCKYISYDTESLKNSLLKGVPVLLEARSSSSGHAFIADCYKRYRTVVRNTYEWVYDSRPTDQPVPEVPGKVEYTYYSPIISMIGMNWGWGPSYNNGDWYSLTGDWINKDDPDQDNWNISRAMIHEFTVK